MVKQPWVTKRQQPGEAWTQAEETKLENNRKLETTPEIKERTMRNLDKHRSRTFLMSLENTLPQSSIVWDVSAAILWSVRWPQSYEMFGILLAKNGWGRFGPDSWSNLLLQKKVLILFSIVCCADGHELNLSVISE